MARSSRKQQAERRQKSAAPRVDKLITALIYQPHYHVTTMKSKQNEVSSALFNQLTTGIYNLLIEVFKARSNT